MSALSPGRPLIELTGVEKVYRDFWGRARVRALPQRVNRGKGCPTPARFAYDRLGPLPPVARGHGGKPAPHAVATFASSIKIFGQRSTPCRGAAAAATKRRRNR